MVTPSASKWKLVGRCSETGSLNRSWPSSDSHMISAAMTVFVMLAMANCERSCIGCSPSAVPAAPDHASPSAASTVAVTPGSPSSAIAASRTACRSAVVEPENEPVGTAGKCPREYVTSAGEGEALRWALGLEPLLVDDMQAVVRQSDHDEHRDRGPPAHADHPTSSACHSPQSAPFTRR